MQQELRERNKETIRLADLRTEAQPWRGSLWRNQTGPTRLKRRSEDRLGRGQNSAN
jgi:hypothetical protein